MARHLVITLIIVIAAAARAADDEEPGYRPLFDGRSLAGWEGDERVFRVQHSDNLDLDEAGRLLGVISHRMKEQQDA